MTLKNAALLALIGTILATVLLMWTFVFNVVNVLRGLAPPVMLVSWFIYAFACFSVAVFFYVFQKAQSLTDAARSWRRSGSGRRFSVMLRNITAGILREFLAQSLVII